MTVSPSFTRPESDSTVPPSPETCPKCGQLNPQDARFCSRCHATLQFVCPACQHRQLRGGMCERCGVDFIKYALALQFQAEGEARRERERAKSRNALLKQLLLLPVTGGWSLMKYLKSALRDG